MSKLHPHIKHFIKTIVLTEMGEKLGPSNSYKWKEGLMVEIQDLIASRIEQVNSQEDLQALIEQVVDDFHATKVIPTLNMIKQTLKQVPIDIIKTVAKRKT